jgi:hypothetical protein
MTNVETLQVEPVASYEVVYAESAQTAPATDTTDATTIRSEPIRPWDGATLVRTQELDAALERLAARHEISTSVIGRARALVPSLAVVTALHRLPWKPPHVSFDEDSQVLLEWWVGRRKLTIHIGETETTFLRVWGPHIFEEMDEGEVSQPLDVVAPWRWLLTQAP